MKGGRKEDRELEEGEVQEDEATVLKKPRAENRGRKHVRLQSIGRQDDMVAYTEEYGHEFGSIEWSTVFSRFWKIDGECKLHEAHLLKMLDTLVLVLMRDGMLDARCLSSVMHGSAKMALPISDAFVTLWLQAARVCLRDFTAQGLCNSFWGLATHNVPHSLGTDWDAAMRQDARL